MLRNLLAVLAGVFVGGLVNMGLITVGPLIIPPPAGVDMTTAEGLQAGIALLEPRHFVFPFLAHALGTLVGAALTARLAVSHHARLALVIGVVFLVGGIMAATMIPAPSWFIALDLIAAYIPMAWLGGRLARRRGDVPFGRLTPVTASGAHGNLAYSARACLRTGMSGSAFFHSVKRSSYAAFALTGSP